MKTGIVLLILLTFFQAQAVPICAATKAELPNIKEITKKVNLFGTWTGTWDNKPISAKLYVNSDLKIRGVVTADGSEYGPTDIKICNDNGQYFLEVYGYEVVFEVLSKNKIKGYSPFDENENAVLTKQ